MGLLELAASLVLMSGGASVPVECSPGLAVNGRTWYEPARVELSPKACAGVLLLGASALERARIVSVNRVDGDWLMAFGALTVAHEAQHTAGVVSEGEAQCRAVRLAPGLLARFLSGRELARAVADVSVIHAVDAPVYRTVC